MNYHWTLSHINRIRIKRDISLPLLMSFQFRSRTQDKETMSEADTPKVKSEAASLAPTSLHTWGEVIGCRVSSPRFPVLKCLVWTNSDRVSLDSQVKLTPLGESWSRKIGVLRDEKSAQGTYDHKGRITWNGNSHRKDNAISWGWQTLPSQPQNEPLCTFPHIQRAERQHISAT